MGGSPGRPTLVAMNTTFLAARVGGARLAKSAARRYLSTFRLTGGAGALGAALSVPAAVVTALRALDEVPAYADFVAAGSGGSAVADIPTPLRHRAHFRLFKQTLGWTCPKVRTPQAAARNNGPRPGAVPQHGP